MIINLNDTIKVKLNDRGKDIFYHQYDALISSCPEVSSIKPHFPKVDEDGYSSFQIWYFMQLYGPYMKMTTPPVLESLNVIYEGE